MMDLQELKKKKTEFETEIRGRILTFSTETGVSIERIRFEMWMEGETPHCTAVILDISLFDD